MDKLSYPDISQSKPGWSSIDSSVKGDSQALSFRFFQWWYWLTTPVEPPTNASFIKRDSYRKARLLSNVAFFLIATLAFFVPACLFLPSPYIIYIDSAEILVSCICLLLNRLGLTLIAGIVQVISFEVALTSVLLIMTPVDDASIQILDLFIMGELLAVSLLPVHYVFIIAFYNSLFMWFNISYQPHTLVMMELIHAQFIPIMARAIGLQFMVAGVSSIWVYNTTKAIIRADRAELVAALEHTLVEQRKELESGIKQILQTHVSVANGNLNARAPLAQDHMLWHIARALNNLLIRLQRASLSEKELYRVENAISNTINIIQEYAQQHQHVRIPFTQTAIDPLIAAMQGKTFDVLQAPWQQNNSQLIDPINRSTLDAKNLRPPS